MFASKRFPVQFPYVPGFAWRSSQFRCALALYAFTRRIGVRIGGALGRVEKLRFLASRTVFYYEKIDSVIEARREDVGFASGRLRGACWAHLNDPIISGTLTRQIVGQTILRGASDNFALQPIGRQ